MHKDVRALPVRLLYQDEALVVVDKPSGMLVHRSPGARDPIVVMLWVRDLLGVRTWPVHRLDRQTSGAVVVAIDEEAARRLSRLFVKGRVEKTYLALVAGKLHEPGCIDAALEKAEGRMQEARTEYVPLLSEGGRTWVRVHPVQGRRHQIRRHFAMIGHPLLGDATYGDPAENERARAEGDLDRLALHAVRIAFVHPITREALAVEAPIPDDLAAPLRRLGFAQTRVCTSGSEPELLQSEDVLMETEDLRQARCVPCEGGTPSLKPDEVRDLLTTCPAWTLEDQAIERTLKFADFKQALAFVNRVGDLAEQQGHHPDVSIFSYNQVRIRLSTHATGGLSRNDFIVAAHIDRLVEEGP